MADDENTYLQPDFDPSTLTVPKLRSILVAHNVAYPSSAKKPDLIGLFNENVASQAKKLRTAQSRTKRSTKGIVDVPSGQSSVIGQDDDEEDQLRPLETPARKSSRRTTRAATEDAVAATPRTSRSARQSTAPASSKKVAPTYRVVDEQDGGRLTARRTRQSVSPAVAKAQEPDEPKYYDEGPESPFSKENPFQSGSPPADARAKSSDRRRTLGVTADDDRRKSRELRRKTEGFGSSRQSGGALVPSTRQAAAIKTEQDEADNMLAGEEFTPEEQQNLQVDRVNKSAVALRPKRKGGPSGVAKVAPWSVLVALLGGVATVWRQEKLQVGYCGVGEPSSSFAGVELPEWASSLQPQCEPCPQHAYCYPDLRTVCEPDFILNPHPLSLGGFVPLPPTCEPDSEKVRKIKQVADFAVDNELRERNAKHECGEIKSAEISEEELKTTLSAKRSRKMSDQEFNELWESALGEIIGREEVTSKVDGTRNVRLLRSSSLARVPLSCAVRRSVRSTLRQHLSKLVGVLLLSMSAVYGKHALTTRRSTSTRAKQLAGLTLDKLATQAALNAEDPTGVPEPYVSMVALRDDVLREEFSAKERGRLWEVVKQLVEGNANVRSMVREGRTGEVSRVWEWIGAVQRIESPEAGASARRKSTRFSLGGAGMVAGSPGRFIDAGDEEQDGSRGEMTEVKKWKEGPSSYF